MDELGIYIHIPFCVKKCYYCDFVSFAKKGNKVNEYYTSLIKEIGNESKRIKESVSTIYIGGGTPSFIHEKYITGIIATIKKYYNIEKNAEITIEVNPRNSK